jgi:(2Fe-2S) ferredoxin
MQTRFELRGEFAGFERDARGKRRMVVRTDTASLQFKVPKELRRQLTPVLSPGCLIAVAGVEEREPFFGFTRRVASQVRVLSPVAQRPSACATCPIRVCTKKACWNNGGKELWHALERELNSAELKHAVELKGVSCLGNCKRGPNVEVRRARYQLCPPEEAREVVRAAAAHVATKR